MDTHDIVTTVNAYAEAVIATGDQQRVRDALKDGTRIVGGELVDASYQVLQNRVVTDAVIHDRIAALTTLDVLAMVARRVGAEQRDELPSCDRHGREILTVGQLRVMLADLPADTHVVLGVNDPTTHPSGADYENVSAVGIPTWYQHEWGQSDYQCVTLIPGSPFDSRQF